MDAIQTEKIYVAVGNDAQDGFKTLNWTLNKWNSHPISIVILHVTHNTPNDYVYTPFGKLPARSVSDEKLQILRKDEQEKINKLLSKYIAFCGKVPVEIVEVEKLDEPMQKHVIDLIYGLGITKLIVGFSFMKPSLKSKSAIGGLFYVHQHKPGFCELFIICGGKQVFLRGKNDEKIMEDDHGVMVARMRDKITFKEWLDKLFNDKTNDSQDTSASLSSTNLESPLNRNQWEFYLQEIENYYQELLSSKSEEGSCVPDNDDSQISPIEPHVTEHNNSNVNAAEKIEMLKSKLNEAKRTIELKRKEAEDNKERHAKAEWAICLCNSRGAELESRIREEVSGREELEKEAEAEKEQREEMRMEVEEKKRRLTSLAEVQSELSNRLQLWKAAKTRAETQLEKAVAERREMVREIEELRRQRDVLNRRIEFCKQKDAIGMAVRLADTSCTFREYTEEELRLATDNFSERLRLKSAGDWTNVYRARFNHSTVAIKMLPSLSRQHFHSKVRLLGDIRQPHLVAMVGFCSEPKCVVLEYMRNGSLRDMLFSRRKNRALRWHDRIRIAAEVCSGLGFLNAAESRPVIHCHLTPSKVLLDCNLVAKITGFGLHECRDEKCNVESDLRAIGVLLMNLLTGRNWGGLVEEVMDREALGSALDEMAGQWPLDLAQELAGLAMRCMSIKSKPNSELIIARVLEELNEIRRKADEIVGREGRKTIIGGCIDREGSSDVPSVFFCPILQEVMKNPHVAADGFSYELEAIEHWLQSGRDTSPMTNLRLKHTFLTPNHTLRSLIQDWKTNKSPQVAH
ncbi:putative U-box domain-containing protein 50 [Mucuna pruriens]|uniref:RING-type E3 ubiquitin transferase n=1 Tax=Mucuna pruriens TaxID=157652 RepID=A0A371FU67_MUCPR|nr:putative U-box domain-containing protein 50 [Mucuna pruriens]